MTGNLKGLYYSEVDMLPHSGNVVMMKEVEERIDMARGRLGSIHIRSHLDQRFDSD